MYVFIKVVDMFSTWSGFFGSGMRLFREMGG